MTTNVSRPAARRSGSATAAAGASRAGVRWPIVLAVLGLLAAALIVGSNARKSGFRAPPKTDLSPQQVFHALLETPFAPAALPGQFGVVGIGASDNAGERALAYHALGEVNVQLSGPDATNQIAYTVYPSEQEAKDSYAQITLGYAQGDQRNSSIGGAFTPTDEEYPAKCLTGPLTVQSGQFGGSYCFVRVGNVEVTALSLLPGDTPRGNDANAKRLAKAAVTHLIAVETKR